MHILIAFVNVLRNNLDEAEGEYTVILIYLTHTYPVVIVGLEVLSAHDLSVACVISTDRITTV